MTRPEIDQRIKPVSLKDTKLFKPIKLSNNIELKHRAILAPLTRLKGDGETFIPDVELASEYYDQRSKRQGTLVITEGILYSKNSAGYYGGISGIWNDEQIESWSKIFHKIKDNGSFVVAQLFALGRQALPEFIAKHGLVYRAPSSGIYIDDGSAPYSEDAEKFNTPLTGFTTEEVEQEVKDFVQAGVNSIKAGADGVQVHAANGYLLNEFLDPETNRRTDKYGGSIENRSRFVLEIVDSLTEAIGADKISVRFSPWSKYGGLKGAQDDPTLLAQYAHIVGELEKRRLKGSDFQFIDILEPRVDGANDKSEKEFVKTGTNQIFYDIWGGVIVRAGNYVANIDSLVKDVDNDRTLISLGRYFISNPDLVDRLEQGWPLTKYDRSTFYTGGSEGYIDYPTYKDGDRS